MPIKVLQLGSPMGLYGAERWVLALIKHLNPTKVKSIVSVIMDDASLDLELCREASNMGFETAIFEAPGRFNFKSVIQLRRYIQQKRIKILHSHGYKQDFIGYLATRWTGCKIISTPHGWSENAGFKLMCYEMFDRILFPFLDAVAPLSRDLEKNLRGLPGMKNKLHFIRNGVDISEVDDFNDISQTMRQWKQEGNFIIGYIGQLIPRKGLDTLLKAVSILDDDFWKLAVVGDGEQKKELFNLADQLNISNKVTFFGFQADRLGFLKGFDVFVLPSRLEGIPRCLMEAMAAKVPIIASDIPGCYDLIDHHVTGLLFPAEDHTSLARNIMELSLKPEKGERLAQKAREYVEEMFSATRMAKEYESLFHNLVS